MAVGQAALSARKADFPLLARRIHGRPLVYLDSAATSQKPRVVLEAMDAYYRETNANVHRGVYELAAEATARFEAGRIAFARLINAPLEGCVFTKNATEAINLVAWAWGVRTLQPGDEIVITEMEHHSNIVPWQLVGEITGAKVRFAAITEDGRLDLEDLGGLIGSRTRMVSVVHVRNTLGTINPVARIAEMAHAVGAYCLIDGAQSTPHLPVDFAAIGADFFAATGHKMLGPTGIGILAAKPEILEEMEPFMGGGEMISDVRKDGSDWNQIPHKFEAGTPPIAEAVGLAAACEYLMDIGMDHVRAHEQSLAGYMLDALSEIPDITIFGPRNPEQRGAAVSFALPDIHPHDLAQLVDQHGVAIRAGHHCTKPLMRCLGVPATARASGHLYTSAEDIDVLIEAIGKARSYLAG